MLVSYFFFYGGIVQQCITYARISTVCTAIEKCLLILETCLIVYNMYFGIFFIAISLNLLLKSCHNNIIEEVNQFHHPGPKEYEKKYH